MSTNQRIKELQDQASPVQEQQSEDPFRTLRSFHEKQRVERQGENPPRMSVSSHSMLKGAVGGAEAQYPKPQRVTKKHQSSWSTPTDDAKATRDIVNYSKVVIFKAHTTQPHTWIFPVQCKARFVGDVD